MLKLSSAVFLTGIILAYLGKEARSTAPAGATLQNLEVETPLGQIRGSSLTSRLGKTIYSFRGIRYAKAPIDNLRFQPPVPIDTWNGTYDATEDGPVCPQPSDDPVSEDCLRLNVYTTKLPEANGNPRRPVIVYLHAGGYYSGAGTSGWAGPQYLLDHEIVLVTINYRLGSLGFLSTGTKEAPGNNGLKDQVQALRWVKQNVEAFGGDPDLVTLMGYSAGGASVSLHLVSPMSRGLFHRAIIMSSSAYSQWDLGHHQINLAKKQARFVGCPEDTSPERIIECLKTKSAEELGNTLRQFEEFGYDPIYIWYPTIEKDFGQERFLPDHPIRLLQNGQFVKVPVLLGITSNEFAGSAFTVVLNSTLTEEMETKWNEIAPICFIYERDTEHSREVSQTLRTVYLKGKPVGNSTLKDLGELYADSVTGFAINRATKLLADKSQNVYYYEFSYQGRYSHFYIPGSNGTIPYGVAHHDDLIYLFYISELFPLFNDTDPEWQAVRRHTLMWTNFAKTGNPTPEKEDILDNVIWEPYNLETQKYMEIGEKLLQKEKLFEERYSVWERLFPLSEYAK